MIEFEKTFLQVATNAFSSAAEKGDPCGVADAILSNKQAHKDYIDAMIRGDMKAAREAYNRGNLKGLVSKDLLFKIKPDLRAAKELNKPPVSSNIPSFQEHYQNLVDKGIDLSDPEKHGLYSPYIIADSKKFTRSKLFTSYFEGSTEQRYAKDAFKTENFPKIFNENLKIGDFISSEEYDRLDESLKKAAKKYNQAINMKKTRTLAKRIIYDSEDVQTGVQRFLALQRGSRDEARRLMNQFQQKLAKVAPAKIQDKELGENICKEIFGEYTGDSNAKQVAETFAASQKVFKKELGKHGILFDLQKGYMPTSYDARKIANASFDEFYDDAAKYIERLPEETEDEFKKRMATFKSNMGRRAEDKASSKLVTDEPVKVSVKYSKRINFKDGSSYFKFAERYGLYNKPAAIISDAIENNTKLMARADLFGTEEGANFFHKIVEQEMDKLGEFVKVANAERAFTDADAKASDVDVYKNAEDKLIENGMISKNHILYDSKLTSKERLTKLEESGVLPKGFIKQMNGDSNDLFARHWSNKQKAEFDDICDYSMDKIRKFTTGKGFMNKPALVIKDLSNACALLGSVTTVMLDRITMMLEYSRAGYAPLESFLKSLSIRKFTPEEYNTLGVLYSGERRVAMDDGAEIINKFNRKTITGFLHKVSFVDKLSSNTKATLREALCLDLHKNLEKYSYDELPKELQSMFDRKSWKIIKDMKERRIFPYRGVNQIYSPYATLEQEGLSTAEIEANKSFARSIEESTSRAVQEGDFIADYKKARLLRNMDNPLLKAISEGLLTFSGVAFSYSRKIVPSLLSLAERGQYGTLLAVAMYATFMTAGRKVINNLVTGKGFDGKKAQSFDFWRECLLENGLMYGWTANALINAWNADNFKDAAASLIQGSGVRTSFDAMQLMKHGLEGDRKGFAKYSRSILQHDLSLQRLPVAGPLLQRTVTDHLVDWVDPEAAEYNRRAQERARKRGIRYYWAPG